MNSWVGMIFDGKKYVGMETVLMAIRQVATGYLQSLRTRESIVNGYRQAASMTMVLATAILIPVATMTHVRARRCGMFERG